jgi:CRP/FNR family cyclic AMP-dependent transcriptional regulator
MPAAAMVALAKAPLFAELTPAELEALGSHASVRKFGKGTVLFLQGDPGTCLYVVETGRIKIVRALGGREVVVAVRGAGELIGDLALLDGAPRSADAVTAEACRLAVLWREDFDRFLETHPPAARRRLTILTQRLRQATQLLEEATLLDVGARIASALLHLAEEDRFPGAEDSQPGEHAVIGRPLTQVDLAAIVGVTRESVNKWTRYYARLGLIDWKRGRLVILRPAELRRHAA